MAAPPCKGVKKDGAPCRGNGNEQLDGYCIAHGAPEKTRAWRVRGGENSSTAARADKRIPERFRPVIQAVTNGIAEVREGTLKPAAYSAICGGTRLPSRSGWRWMRLKAARRLAGYPVNARLGPTIPTRHRSTTNDDVDPVNGLNACAWQA